MNKKLTDVEVLMEIAELIDANLSSSETDETGLSADDIENILRFIHSRYLPPTPSAFDRILSMVTPEVIEALVRKKDSATATTKPCEEKKSENTVAHSGAAV